MGSNCLVQANGTFSLQALTTVAAAESVVAYSGFIGGPASAPVFALAGLPPPVTTTAIPFAGGSTLLTTSAPPGALVEVVDLSAGGEVLGSQTASSSGVVAVQLSSPATAGQTLDFIEDGVVTGSVTMGPAGSPPALVSGSVLVGGSVIIVSGTPNAQIQVIDSQGRVLGSGVVTAQGQASISVSGGTAGEAVYLVQNGVAIKLTQPNLALGNARVFLNSNIFRPLQGSPLVIGFKAADNGRLTVKVFDMSGEMVRFVDEQEVDANQLYSTNWDGRNQNGEWVGSGIYIVSVYGAGTRVLKKVVVLK